MKRIIVLCLLVALLCSCGTVNWLMQNTSKKDVLVFVGKTLLEVMTAEGYVQPPPYNLVVFDVETVNGITRNKAVYPEWRSYDFGTFSAIVEAGGKDDGLVLAVIPK